ncbi:MAG: hypothetical protein ACR2IE_03875 [Candidatus Sumerlaeaceae bacterium]
MFLPILGITTFLALVIVIGIAYFTRERAGHDVRRDVRHAVINNQPPDPRRGIRS